MVRGGISLIDGQFRLYHHYQALAGSAFSAFWRRRPCYLCAAGQWLFGQNALKGKTASERRVALDRPLHSSQSPLMEMDDSTPQPELGPLLTTRLLSAGFCPLRLRGATGKENEEATQPIPLFVKPRSWNFVLLNPDITAASGKDQTRLAVGYTPPYSLMVSRRLIAAPGLSTNKRDFKLFSATRSNCCK